MKSKTLLLLLISFVIIHINSIAQNTTKQDEQSGLYGIVNEDGDYVVKPKYKEVDFNFGYKTGLSYVIDKNDKYGFIDQTGKEVVPCKYDNATGFENGLSVVKVKTGEYDYKFGLMDTTGKEVIPLKWGRMEHYPLDHVLVVGEENASKVGVIDEKGKVIIAPQYAFWSKRISNGLWPVGRNDTCGVVNLKNETIVPFEYYMIESYSDKLNVAVAKKVKDGKWGYIDRTGKAVIPFMYDDAWGGYHLLIVKKGGKWGVIDLNNKVIIPFEYYAIDYVLEKTAWVIKNDGEEHYELDLKTLQKVVK